MMSEFSIKFVGRPTNGSEAVGQLVADDAVEGFRSALGFWRQPDYERQWEAGLRRVTDRRLNSCLITETVGPGRAGHLFMYLLYPAGASVFIQEKLVIADRLPDRFDPSDPFALVGPRMTVNDDGEQILEWRTTMDAITRFVVGAS